jgi:hypothetical protein
MHRKNNLPHSTSPLGRQFHSGQSSRYLGAHNCSTNDFRAAFKFLVILGCTTYMRVLGTVDHCEGGSRKSMPLVPPKFNCAFPPLTCRFQPRSAGAGWTGASLLPCPGNWPSRSARSQDVRAGCERMIGTFRL